MTDGMRNKESKREMKRKRKKREIVITVLLMEPEGS